MHAKRVSVVLLTLHCCVFNTSCGLQAICFLFFIYICIWLFHSASCLAGLFSACSELLVPRMTQPWILHLTEHAHTHSITYIIYVKTSIQLNGPPCIYHLGMTLPESTMQSDILLIKVAYQQFWQLPLLCKLSRSKSSDPHNGKFCLRVKQSASRWAYIATLLTMDLQNFNGDYSDPLQYM